MSAKTWQINQRKQPLPLQSLYNKKRKRHILLSCKLYSGTNFLNHKIKMGHRWYFPFWLNSCFSWPLLIYKDLTFSLDQSCLCLLHRHLQYWHRLSLISTLIDWISMMQGSNLVSFSFSKLILHLFSEKNVWFCWCP